MIFLFSFKRNRRVSMLEVSDIKHLKRSQTRSAKIGIWLLPAVACVLIVGGGLNIHVGSKFAAMQAVGFGELFRLWFQGIQIDAQYSGVFLMAVTRFQMGITGFVYGVLVAVFSYFYGKSVQRNRRILKFMEDHSQKPA
jgi:hypothetical protein